MNKRTDNFYKAIIFDLDGTLLDTIEDIADCSNKILKKYNFPAHKTHKYKLFVGDGIETLVSRILPKKYRADNFIKKIVKEIKNEYNNNWGNKTKPYPSIINLLKHCQLKKLKMAVLSNKPDRITKIMVKHFFPEIKFDYVFGARKNRDKKPSPKVALQIAKNFNLTPNRIIYLGDTSTDMQTAKRAGMFAVGVLWGFRCKNELIKNGADIVIKKPLELFSKGIL